MASLEAAASLEPEEAEDPEGDVAHKRPAWAEVELTTGTGKVISVKLQSLEDNGVWVPFRRRVAVSDAYVIKQWPFMVAACMTINRAQGVEFERVAVWIPSRGFFAQGQGYSAFLEGKTLDGLFLVLPDNDLGEDAAREMLIEAFHPPNGRHQRALRVGQKVTGGFLCKHEGEKRFGRHSLGQTGNARRPRRLARRLASGRAQ